MSTSRKYEFSWGLLGDLDEGRPNLGRTTRVEVYRLMQFCFRDVLEATLGTEMADEVFYRAGHLAGQHFFAHEVAPVSDLAEFVRKLQAALQEMRVGVLRVEQEELEHGRLLLTISEDLDCSGLPELSYEVCTYDEGFVAGILEAFTGKRFKVKEVDCWCTGDRTCRFLATHEAPMADE